jgi:hypothetical protein
MKQVLDEISAFNPALKFDEAQLAQTGSPEKLYTFEKETLTEGTIIPLAHLPQLYGLSARVHDWIEPAAGGWPLANVWLQKSNSTALNGEHP